MELTLKDVLKIFKRSVWVILALTIIGGACAGLYAILFKSAKFNSNAEMRWEKGIDIQTCIEYVKGDALMAVASEAISDRYKLSAEQIREMVSAERVGDSKGVFIVTVSHVDSSTAYYVCDALIQKMPEVFNKLGMTVSVLSSPSINPVYTKNIVNSVIIGGVVGAILGVVVAFILYCAFKTVYTRSDVEKYFNIDVIGAVSNKDKENALKLLGVNALDTAFAGDCKKIAVAGVGKEKDYNLFEKSINVFIGKGCDSACDSGKDLALAVAGLDKKTLYIDGKISKANTSVFGIEFESGLSEYLTENTELVIKDSGIANLSVICAGNGVENSTQALSSVKMKETLDKLAEQFDCIILDLPSVGLSVDALAVHGIVDGYVLAVKAGGNSINQINNAVGTLCQLSANVHGIILDDAKSSDVFGGRELLAK